MKTKNIPLAILILVISIGKLKAQDTLIKNSVHVSPFVGFNTSLKAPVYGAEIGYEYRLNKRLGLTAGMNIAYTQKNYAANGSVTPKLKFLQNAIYGGAKYYLGQVYISADLGYEDSYKTNISGDKGISYSYGTYATNSFYQAYGIGYQLPLKKGDNLEFFAKTAHANQNTNCIVGFRYSFGLFRRK